MLPSQRRPRIRLHSAGRALDQAPDHVPAANNRALALSVLGNVYAELGGRDDAITAYQESAVAYDEVPGVAPDSIPDYANKGGVRQSL
jgi:hypothetical protein